MRTPDDAGPVPCWSTPSDESTMSQEATPRGASNSPRSYPAAVTAGSDSVSPGGGGAPRSPPSRS